MEENGNIISDLEEGHFSGVEALRRGHDLLEFVAPEGPHPAKAGPLGIDGLLRHLLAELVDVGDARELELDVAAVLGLVHAVLLWGWLGRGAVQQFFSYYSAYSGPGLVHAMLLLGWSGRGIVQQLFLLSLFWCWSGSVLIHAVLLLGWSGRGIVKRFWIIQGWCGFGVVHAMLLLGWFARIVVSASFAYSP